MDDGRFDGLTRIFGKRRSRRAIAGLVASGTLSGLLDRLVQEVAAAKKRKKRPQPCKLKCPAWMIAAEGICVTGQGTCVPGNDTCGLLPSTGSCNNARDCRCVVAVDSGDRCGKAPTGLECGQCTTDSQCAVFGPGAFCVLSTNNTPDRQCSCPTVGQGFCLLPC
jgi:hypothetical protein